jgi:hypothetical protein
MAITSTTPINPSTIFSGRELLFDSGAPHTCKKTSLFWTGRPKKATQDIDILDWFALRLRESYRTGVLN